MHAVGKKWLAGQARLISVTLNAHVRKVTAKSHLNLFRYWKIPWWYRRLFGCSQTCDAIYVEFPPTGRCTDALKV